MNIVGLKNISNYTKYTKGAFGPPSFEQAFDLSLSHKSKF